MEKAFPLSLSSCKNNSIAITEDEKGGHHHSNTPHLQSHTYLAALSMGGTPSLGSCAAAPTKAGCTASDISPPADWWATVDPSEWA